MTTAILFDLDGTLLDTAPDLVVAVNALRGDYNLPPLAFDVAVAMVGKGAHNLIMRALTLESPVWFEPDAAYQQFAAHYHRVNGVDAREYDGVSVVLRELHQRGFQMAVVTNKPTEFTLPLIKQFGWVDYFGSVVCGDTLNQRKPSAEPILHACAQLAVDVKDALMVGDSMNDLLAARASACECVLLDYGYNEGRPIREVLKNDDTRVYSNFSEILDFL